MGNDNDSVVTASSVIAIAQEEGKLRGVKLRKQGGTFEVLWTRSGEVGQTEWRSFAAECGFSPEKMAKRREKLKAVRGALKVNAEAGGDKIIVGFDSAGVAFYRLDVPAVKRDEIAAMVKLQVEARLPLPAEQMELAWRAGRVQDGQVAVTVAAARRGQLQGFVENVRDFGPAKILLDCEGIVKTWRTFFSGNEEPAVVVSVGTRNTRVCLADRGRLVNAVSLDVGMEDFSAGHGLVAQAESAERFAQDMRSVLELFGYADAAKLPVFVLSDGSRTANIRTRVWEAGEMEGIVSSLVEAGLNAQVAVPEIQKLSAETELSVEDIYEYRVPIGLALIVLDGDTEELNIFERLYSPAREEEKGHPLYSPKVAGAIAAVMLAVLLVVSCVFDVAGKKRWVGSETEKNCDMLVQRQKLIKAVARERQKADVLGLLNKMNLAESDGIMLDSLDFKKGKSVTITGQAPGAEKLYKFQESLLTRKGIRNVKIQSAPEDKKSKKLRFTVKFDYKSSPKGEAKSRLIGKD